METRDKIVHLLNRFGLGATSQEVDGLLPLGVDGSVQKLVNYDKAPDRFPVHPAEFVFRDDRKANLEPQRMTLHWILRMAATNRPLEEKLTLFWHNHFAISGVKVYSGPAMQDYLDILRKNASGNFGTMLAEVSKTPAMLLWLDAATSLKGKPNENFGRELMELFTLGIGNYTESDVKEASRAFTGWGVRYPYNELGSMPADEKLEHCYEHDMPFVAFTDAPDMWDLGQKSILGKKGRFTSADVLAMMASHPITAKRMMTKLWSFFAYEHPEPEVADHLAKKFLESNLEIKPVLVEMTKMPQFWSKKAVGTMVKSPVDFTVAAMRQFRLGEQYLTLRAEGASFRTPLNGGLVNQLNVASRMLRNQGLLPLFPPDVSGWRWGTAWLGAGAMLERAKVTDLVFAGTKEGPVYKNWLKDAKDAGTLDTCEKITDHVLKTLNVKLDKARREELVALVKAKNGETLIKQKRPQDVVRGLTRILITAPEYQLC